MTNLLSERSPVKMLPGKRSFENGTGGSRFLRGLKRPRVSAIRQFPPGCGPAASKVREAFNEARILVKTSDERTETTPSKPNAEILQEVPEKIELVMGNQDSIPKHIDIISKKNLSLKPRKGVTVFRDFPRGCGRTNLDVSAKHDALTNDVSVDEERRRLQAEKGEMKNDVAKSPENKIGFTGVTVCPSMNESITVAHADGSIVPATDQLGVKTTEDCIVATGGTTDECGYQKCNINGSQHYLLLEGIDTKTKALPDQEQNGALLVKQSYALTNSSHQEALSRTQEILNLFEQILKERLLEMQREKPKSKNTISNLYTNIAMVLKKQKKWIHMDQKLLGAIPGVEVGDQFHFRAELVIVGLHKQFSAGIDYMEKDGKKIATSIVSSGRYSSGKEFSDVLIYSGQGGNQIKGEKNFKDQELVRGNLALKNSMDEKTPVRVILGRRSWKTTTFTYDGLYFVSKFWQERAENGKLVYMFQLERMHGQPKIKSSTLQRFVKSKSRDGLALMNDISEGKEKISIRAVNDVDNEKPPSFIYTTKMVYPRLDDILVETSGCHCIDGCSDDLQCSCILKNGGTLPFNKNGALLETKPTSIVHECGPSCKCPPSCKNRVSQHGIKFQLEIFKTKSKGWGVRSRNYISSGSFICEYIGELLTDKEAEERIDSDEYLFDIGEEDGFAVDAAKIGNIGRFVNHSCSPNLYAQDVLYDHNDKMMPHVMLFATQNIRPLQELTYDYNYKIGQVRDSNGNIKEKKCYCGTAECEGRMY
ncbi:hypothetical protein DCAR_0103932 [Daucus carota subsp. sativus]|uniref:Histone-lysine N-methyltransferase n=2 Tax=Daucus carota subsp. sativus TaxID=79200 RepID=A0AAF1AJE2_DAUCS|nr:PREDICTED: histone-lysine N-methyltransferase, H3 lysine-9 specific SUVH5-like [Daucus carota subsp. sativus]WOG84748.1 hypothetical protein DCAR_0103932 [Daucus carota subsp. sativus]